jgi:DeoR/GlpR family transcriptional regulator of sugar metabolism
MKEIRKAFVIVNNLNIGIAIYENNRCSVALCGLEITKSSTYNPVTDFCEMILDIKCIDKAIIL